MHRPDYGIDAPGLVRAFFSIGGITLILSLGLILGFATLRGWAAMLALTLMVIAIYTLGMGFFMVRYSRVTKLIEREQLLRLIPLTGSEQVLDVGCGRGLLLVEVAKRLTDGKAVGIDIWRAEDQSCNHAAATFENATFEGVKDRVEIHTADMRQLPFSDESFHAVVSHWAIHNLEKAKDRSMAFDEIHRVLKPSGWILIADIENSAEYQTAFDRLELINIRQINANMKTNLMRAISFGSFYPTAILAQKPPMDGKKDSEVRMRG